MSILKSLVFLIALLTFSFFKTYAQSSFSAEQDKTSPIPIFKDGIPGMMSYFNKEIVPVISDFAKDSTTLPGSLKMILTINKKGKVIDVQFVNAQLEEDCKRLVAGRLLKMRGWKAAEFNGEAVIAQYNWNISCLLWQ